MSANNVKTQGTELFLIDVSNTDGALVKMTCPTGISGLGGPAGQIDSTCLDVTTDKTFIRGLGVPGQVSVPFNLVTKDPAAIHQELFALKDGGTVLDWLICMSDGTGEPTVDTDFAFVKPTTRSTVEFQGYISDLNLDISGDAIVKGTMTIQRSGAVTAIFLQS